MKSVCLDLRISVSSNGLPVLNLLFCGWDSPAYRRAVDVISLCDRKVNGVRDVLVVMFRCLVAGCYHFVLLESPLILYRLYYSVFVIKNVSG